MTALRQAAEIEYDPTRPRQGRSVAGSVAPLARDMISALVVLKRVTPALAGFEWLMQGSRSDHIEHPDVSERKAWAVAAITALYGLHTSSSPRCAIALRWFGDATASEQLHSIDLSVAEEAIARVCRTSAAAALFPYILDTFGPTSRLDVIRDVSRKGSRIARKQVGSFYTPSDVADFMVDAVANSFPERAFWFDPACGSGIFLLAALRRVELRGLGVPEITDFAINNLHGIDISPQAVDFAAFAICARLAELSDVSPKELWTIVRQNLRAADALSTLRAAESDSRSALSRLFGPIDRPIKLVCNPPYVTDTTASPLPARMHCKPVYLSFAEFAWELTKATDDAAAIVVPLAVAANRSADHTRFRSAMAQSGGDWTTLFFDRQPHALFGEEVKARTSILIRRASLPARIKTSRLLKWTSAQRSQIFSEARAVDLGAISINRLIPKLGSAGEVLLYKAISSYRLKQPGRPQLSSISPSDIHHAVSERDVFIGATAYNFLNAYRSYPAPSAAPGPFSESKVHRLIFPSTLEALSGFAILSSRTAFWLWHVEADGFHVPSWFLDEFPLFDLPWEKKEHNELAALGATLWDEAKRNLLASQNAGAWTLAFRPSAISEARDAADRTILEALNLDASVFKALRLFEVQTTSVDGKQRVGRAGEREQSIIRMLPK